MYSTSKKETAPLKLDAEPDRDDLDEDALHTLVINDGVITLLELMGESVRDGTPPETLTQQDIDTAEAAHRAGQRLREHDAYEQFLTEGPDALPDTLALEVYETFAPFAPVFGFEMEVSNPDRKAGPNSLTGDLISTVRTLTLGGGQDSD